MLCCELRVPTSTHRKLHIITPITMEDSAAYVKYLYIAFDLNNL